MRNRKRILFIERGLRNEKLGIMYLSASLKAAGHHAELLQADKEDLDTFIREYRPHFVAFSVTTGEHRHALDTARLVKLRYGIPNIFGGPHCTFFPELAYEPDVDFVVQGQGERAIVDIVEGRTATGFTLADTALPLDDLPFPDRNIFYKHEEFRNNPMKNVITSRACPYKCAYCFNHSQLALAHIDGQTANWFTRRSVHNVVAEINDMRERYPLEKVLYIDDSFIQRADWLEAFLSQYPRDVGLPWLSSLRVNRLTERLVERMADSGLEMVNYALESADPDVQQRLLNRGRITNRHVLRAIALFERFGVRARMQNMIGLPIANPLEDALNTLQFNLRHEVTDSWCSIFQPYPRTALGQYCVDHGYATSDQLYHCARSFFDESRINIPNKQELYALQKLWYFAVDARLPVELVQILIRGKYDLQTVDRLQKLRFCCARERLYRINDTEGHVQRDIPGSRQGTALLQCKAPTRQGTAALVRAALSGTKAAPGFVNILEQVGFGLRGREHLTKYLRGERVYDPPVYTINDETGELVDPTVSIYIRGTNDPAGADIRRMSTRHFMRRILDVRAVLSAQSRSQSPALDERSGTQPACSFGDTK